MNNKNSLILSVILLSSGLTYSMEQDKINNSSSMGNFDKLPNELLVKVFGCIFNNNYLKTLSSDQLINVLGLKFLNKEFKGILGQEYKKEIEGIRDKLGIVLIELVRAYKPMNNKWELLGFKDKPLERIKKLIKVGANLNIHNDKLFTALMVACFKCHEDIVKLIINSGVVVNIKNENDITIRLKSMLIKDHIDKNFIKSSFTYTEDNNAKIFHVSYVIDKKGSYNNSNYTFYIKPYDKTILDLVEGNSTPEIVNLLEDAMKRQNKEIKKEKEEDKNLN